MRDPYTQLPEHVELDSDPSRRPRPRQLELTPARIFVVASYKGFLDFCQDRGLNPRNQHVLHISRLEKARGHRPAPDDKIVLGYDGDYDAYDYLLQAQKLNQ